MTREQYIEALEAGCSVHVEGYTIEPTRDYYRIVKDGDQGPPGWHVDAEGALRLVGVVS